MIRENDVLLRRMTDRYRWVLRAVIVIILATMLAIMGLQIVCRYVFNASLIWAEEMCRYLLIWVSFLAIVDAYERGEIAAVTMLRDSLPRRASILLTMVVEGLGIALMVTCDASVDEPGPQFAQAPQPGMMSSTPAFSKVSRYPCSLQ